MATNPATVDAYAEVVLQLEQAIGENYAAQQESSHSSEAARSLLTACIVAGLTPARILPSTLGGVSFYFEFARRGGYVNLTVTDEDELLLTIHDGDSRENSDVQEFALNPSAIAAAVLHAKALVT